MWLIAALRDFMGKRRSRQRKLEKAVLNGHTIWACGICDKKFLNSRALDTHSADAHNMRGGGVPVGINRQGQQVSLISRSGNIECTECLMEFKTHAGLQQHIQTVHRPAGVHILGAVKTAHSDPKPIVQIDFKSPDDSIYCLNCGLPGGIPLTSYCEQCDPIAVLAHDRPSLPNSPSDSCYASPGAKHRITGQPTPPTDPISTTLSSIAETVNRAIRESEQPLLLLPPVNMTPGAAPYEDQEISMGQISVATESDSPEIPAFLDRRPSLTETEIHERMLH